jgi:hypothetical protein
MQNNIRSVAHKSVCFIDSDEAVPYSSLEFELNACAQVVEEVSSTTGYDRVMMYKFHEDMHGEVTARRTL